MADDKPKPKYKLVTMPTIAELNTEVNKAADDGYQPHDAPVCHPPEEVDPQRKWRYSQAMVLPEIFEHNR